MEESKTLIIEGELPDFNTEINAAKRHWGGYSRHKKLYTEAVMAAAKVQSIPKVRGKVAIEFLWYTKDLKKDPDNVCFAKKYILSGLVLSGVLLNDTRQYVLSFTDCFDVDKKRPRVEVNFI